jgi:aminopeptidase YwaD
VAGAIVLFAPSDIPDTARLEAVAEAGAIGAIFHGEGWQRYSVGLPSASIPFLSIEGEGGARLRAEHLGATATLRIERFETSQNVLATRPATLGDPDSAPIVIVSAHYDSVEKSPGASDNGSGTVGLLEIARILAGVPLEVEVRFAAVGAEEVGLVGSRFYAANLPEDERIRVLANFNMDMIGTAGDAQTQLFVNTMDGDNLVAQSARAARAALGFPEDLLRAPFQRGSSDHVAFHDIGIPAANFIWREPETIALEPWYHHPHDRFDNVSPERLGTALQIVLGAMTQVICPVATSPGGVEVGGAEAEG